MMPVYLSSAFVLYREPDIFEAGDEMGYIHKCLLTMPDDLPIEHLLERAGDLYLQYPPSEISSDPMLAKLNKDVYQQFSRIERSKARRMRSHNAPGSRMFVRVTIWTVTAVVAMAMAVIYHTYNDGFELDGWSPFS